jgi:hypothetical protein
MREGRKEGKRKGGREGRKERRTSLENAISEFPFHDSELIKLESERLMRRSSCVSLSELPNSEPTAWGDFINLLALLEGSHKLV